MFVMESFCMYLLDTKDLMLKETSYLMMDLVFLVLGKKNSMRIRIFRQTQVLSVAKLMFKMIQD